MEMEEDEGKPAPKMNATDDQSGSTASSSFLCFVNQLDSQLWRNGVRPDEATRDRAADFLKNVYEDAVTSWKEEETTKTTGDKISELKGMLFSPSQGTDYLFSKDRAALAKQLIEFMSGKQEDKGKERDFVSIAYEVKETLLSHTYDLDSFRDRVDGVFYNFYRSNIGEYIAPYFVFVQSSGMGKTKILFEYKRLIKKQIMEPEVPKSNVGITNAKPENKNDISMDAKMVLCRGKSSGERGSKEDDVFDHFIPFKEILDEAKKDKFNDAVDSIFKKLDRELLKGVTADRLVLMFDEAHYLTDSWSGKDSKGFDAFLFRIIRLWISQEREEKPKIVAVFTGTTAKLTNFIIKDDLKANRTDTREYRSEKKFYERGDKTFDPFCITTTIGCLQNRQGVKALPTTEYEQAIPYGRPLFATMTHEKLSVGLATIASRMVGDTSTWKVTQAAWISILGTRVQMGQTSLEIASDLVGHAYANLVGVTNTSARICFMPDPVCAHLAMALMDANWQMPLEDDKVLKGQDKVWWMGKVKEIYSKGLCSPEKGDLGEVMVALYFLFCADVLRGAKNSEYKDFSVSLGEWISTLVNGGTPPSTEEKPSPKKKTRKQVREKAASLTFSAIQVCRNYVRAYDDSWESIAKKPFLEHLYKSGSGFYVFPGCKTIDLVFPLRLSTGQNSTCSYLPMFVSVKSHVYFGPEKARKECEKMAAKAEKSGIEQALCILVVFGSKSKSTDGKYALKESVAGDLCSNGIVAKVLRVPPDDVFKLSASFQDLTSLYEVPEILSSHSFLGAHAERDYGEFAGSALRARSKKKDDDTALNMAETLLEQLWLESNDPSPPGGKPSLR